MISLRNSMPLLAIMLFAYTIQAFRAWQIWITTLPSTISSESQLKYVNGQPTFKITGLKLGSEPFTEWQSAFSRYNPVAIVTTERYIDAASSNASSYVLPFSKVKSKMIFRPLPCKAVKIAVNFFDTLVRNNPNLIVYFEFGAARGKITESTTSYFPRKALVWIFQFIYWKYETQTSSSLQMIREIYDKLAPYTSPFSYANLIDYDLGQKYLFAYYGNNVNQLIAIKRKYDPTNIFQWRQSIPLSIYSQIAENMSEKYCSLDEDDN